MGKQVKIEIMDTTLRDGEQTSGVSFVPHEKLMIARLLLEELKVDRVEVASARVSDGEADAVRMICDWAARRGLPILAGYFTRGRTPDMRIGFGVSFRVVPYL